MRFSWFVAAVCWFVIVAAGCGGGGDEDGDEVNPSVATATAIAQGATTPTPEPEQVQQTPRATPPPRTPGVPFDEEEAAALLDYALLKPDDITLPAWVIQTDSTTDNAAAAEVSPDQAGSIERCGRLLSRIITNFPPDVTGNYLGGLTVSFFSTATVFATSEGAADCSAENATRLAQPCELARSFASVFIDPCAVVVTPVDFPTEVAGATALLLAGKSLAGDLEIDLTILAVAFNSENVSAVVGSAAPSAPATDELQPYVELVAERIADWQ